MDSPVVGKTGTFLKTDGMPRSTDVVGDRAVISQRGGTGLHDKIWRPSVRRTPRLCPLKKSCTHSFDLAEERGTVKNGARTASGSEVRRHDGLLVELPS